MGKFKIYPPNQIMHYVGFTLGLALFIGLIGNLFGWDYQAFYCALILSPALLKFFQAIGIIFFFIGVIRILVRKKYDYVLYGLAIGLFPLFIGGWDRPFMVIVCVVSGFNSIGSYNRHYRNLLLDPMNGLSNPRKCQL